MTNRAPRCYALVPCAGNGSRAGTPGQKQYHRLGGLSVLGHTLDALTAVRRISATLVVVSPGDSAAGAIVESVLGSSAGLSAGSPPITPPAVWIADCGGATRAISVRQGLQALQDRGAGTGDWVLVHDAARCLVRTAWIDALIDACVGDAVGGLLAAPLADTLKRVDADGRCGGTVPRSGLWQAQTPQMFRLGALQAALHAAGPDVTDEAGAMEAMGCAPKLVACSAENFKLTHPADFALAEVLLDARATGVLPR